MRWPYSLSRREFYRLMCAGVIDCTGRRTHRHGWWSDWRNHSTRSAGRSTRRRMRRERKSGAVKGPIMARLNGGE